MIRLVDIAVLVALTVAPAAFAQQSAGTLTKKKPEKAQATSASKELPSWIYLSGEFSPPDEVLFGTAPVAPRQAARNVKPAARQATARTAALALN